MKQKMKFFRDTEGYLRRMAMVVAFTVVLALLSNLTVYLIMGDVPDLSFQWKLWAVIFVAASLRPTYIFYTERFYYDDDDELPNL